MSAIEQCRSAALGGHVLRCEGCGADQIAYNSCRNRHCPKCQGSAALRWLEDRQSDLLPVAYYHVVFTLPAPVSAIAYYNKDIVYGLLFEIAARTLRTIATDPKHLGARMWVTLACAPGARRSRTTRTCTASSPAEVSPSTHQMGRLQTGILPSGARARRPARRLFLEQLERAHRGTLRFFGEYADLANPARFAQWLGPLRKTEWVVYAKRPFAGPQAVLGLSSRYTHRVAISNSRLVAMDTQRHLLRWKDYRAKGRTRYKTMTLAAEEFMRRFLLHVLPQRIHRIRHYGLLANAARRENLAVARALLHPPLPQAAPPRLHLPVDRHRRASCADIAAAP